jgi:hypothetical protein
VAAAAIWEGLHGNAAIAKRSAMAALENAWYEPPAATRADRGLSGAHAEVG